MLWRKLRVIGSGLLTVISDLFSRLGLSRPASALAGLGIRVCRREQSLFYSQLAMVHERAGNTSEAVAALKEAIELERDEGVLAFYYFELGALHEKRAERDLALVSFEESRKLSNILSPAFRADLEARIRRIACAS